MRYFHTERVPHLPRFHPTGFGPYFYKPPGMPMFPMPNYQRIPFVGVVPRLPPQ